MKLKRILKSRVATALTIKIVQCYIKLVMKFCPIELNIPNEAKPYLLDGKMCFTAAWHSRLFMAASFMARFGEFAMVVSSHGDGELIASIIQSYGHKTIRGSSRNKGYAAIIAVIKSIKDGVRLSITPDGPIGPRFKVKGGMCALAHKYNIPIIPICYSASKIKVLKTWDRLMLPIPFFSKIMVDIGNPIFSTGNLEADKKYLEQIMLNQAQKLDRKNKLKIDY